MTNQEKPGDTDDLGPEIEGMKQFVRDMEEARAKHEAEVPHSVFAVTGLLPRRVLALGFNLLLVVVASLGTYLATQRKSKNEEDSLRLERIETQLLPALNGKYLSLEGRVAMLEGSEVRFDKQMGDLRDEVRRTNSTLQDIRATVARIEVEVKR